jgi:hypothetical protein
MLAAVVMRIAAGALSEWMTEEPADLGLPATTRDLRSSKFFRESSSLQVAAPAASGCRRIGVPKVWHETQRALPSRLVVKTGWMRALKNS